MLGMLINTIEQKELEYMIKRELDELMLDLEDHRIDVQVKAVMRERQIILFRLLLRVANKKECMRYMPKKSQNE